MFREQNATQSDQTQHSQLHVSIPFVVFLFYKFVYLSSRGTTY